MLVDCKFPCWNTRCLILITSQCIATAGFLVYTLILSKRMKIASHAAVIALGLEAFVTFWWLVTFGVLASDAVAWGYVENAVDISDAAYSSVYGHDYFGPGFIAALDCAKAAAGLGALEL